MSSDFRSPVRNSDDGTSSLQHHEQNKDGTEITAEKLIPEKPSSVSRLPPVTINEKANAVALSPSNDEDFQHSINSTPLSRKENLIPVKSPRLEASTTNINNIPSGSAAADTSTNYCINSPPSTSSSFNNILRTPQLNNRIVNPSSLLLNASPIPDLTPPPASKAKTRLYGTLNSSSSPANAASASKRAFSTPVKRTRMAGSAVTPGTTTPLPKYRTAGLSRPTPDSVSGVRKVSTPTMRRNSGPISLVRRTSGSAASKMGKPSAAVTKQFKSPLKNPPPSSSTSRSRSLTPSSLKHSQSTRVNVKELSKHNETVSRVLRLTKSLNQRTEDLKKKTALLTSYKNLKLNQPKTKRHDRKMVQKWLLVTRKLSEQFLETYKAKILEKHQTFREYKLSKYDLFRRSLRWQLINSIDEKFNEMKESEHYEKLTDYEKESIEKDYKYAKKSSLDDFNRLCDIKFREMFKDDIAIAREDMDQEKIAQNRNLTFVKYANSENDVLDEFGMKDLYKDMKMDFDLVYGKKLKKL